MDTKSKILFGILVVIVSVSALSSYYKFMVLHDYLVEVELECDPSLESCFIWTCDAEAGDECTGNAEEDTAYYKIGYRNAKEIVQCDPEDYECIPFECDAQSDQECTEVTCSLDNAEEFSYESTCTDPLEFMTEEEPLLNDEYSDDTALDAEMLQSEESY